MEFIRLADISFIYHIKDILHRGGCNTLDEGSQANLYRAEVPYYVKVMDEYPDTFKEPLVMPSVAVDLTLTREQGLQIGGNYKNFRQFGIHIFAQRSGERDDIGTILYHGLDMDGYVKDYNVAVPDYVYSVTEGRLVEHWSGLVAPAMSDLITDEKTIENVPRTGAVDIDAHRALIRVRTLDLR
jgi:hypothetical protein